MTDPYKVLGVSPDATDDEIKKAYHKLARKYHPDRYINEPELAKSAGEKMKEINAAYEMIQNIRDGKTEYGDTSRAGEYGNSGDYGSSSSDPRYGQVRSYINAGMYDRALATLISFSESERDGEWYYLMGFIEMRRRHYSDAKVYFDRACDMDPDNYEFRYAKQRMEQRAQGYGGEYTYPESSGCSMCHVFGALLCFDCCCRRRF